MGLPGVRQDRVDHRNIGFWPGHLWEGRSGSLEWEPDERDAWVADAERWIGQINGVLQCKIDLDHEGEVTGVHVVAGMEREPRHIVRDVEGLLKARIGVNVFY